MKNTIVKDTLILFIMTAVCGLGLGVVHEITLEPIAQANEAAQQEAYRTVFADADSFVELPDFDAEAATAAATASPDYADDTIEGCVQALDANGELLGYVINASDPSSYGGSITLSVGVRLDGTVNGYSLTDINDTAGLGMNAKTEAFYSQYENKAVDAFVVTKTGATSDEEIDAISGATITSSAVTRAVNAGLAYYRDLMNTTGGVLSE